MNSRRILLVYPPHTRNTEPPLGIAMLIAALRHHHVDVSGLDLNCLTGPELAQTIRDTGDTRTHRCAIHIREAIRKLTTREGYTSFATYQTQMEYYGQALRALGKNRSWTLTPGDFSDSRFPDYAPQTIQRLIENPPQQPFEDKMLPLVERRIQRFQPDIIGLSIIYRTQLIPAISLAATLLNRYPNITFIVGGAFPDALPEPTRHHISRTLGRIVPGCGIRPLLDLLDISNPVPEVFCTPDFSDFDLKNYFSPGPVIPITASQGCYWARCSFCDECRTPYQMDDPELFYQRLKQLDLKYKPDLFHFTDNAIPPEILRKLASKGSPAPWFGFTRMIPQLTDMSFVRSLKDSGCKMLQLGLETPVESLLKKMNKGILIRHVPVILENLHRAGIKSYLYVMFGFPGQTLGDFSACREFLEQNPFDFINASIFRLPPDSTVSIHPAHFNATLASPDPADRLYRRFHTNGPQINTIRKWLSREFYRSPAIRAARNRTPKYYKSNHAVYW